MPRSRPSLRHLKKRGVDPLAATLKAMLWPVRALTAEGWRVIVGATARAVTVRFIELLTAPRLLVMVTVQRPELAIATLLKVHWAVLTPWTMPSRDHR